MSMVPSSRSSTGEDRPSSIPLTERPSIEAKEFEIFCRKYDDGQFAGQRFGQAFYNYFDLHKTGSQEYWNHVYQLDGKAGRLQIMSLFELH